MVTQAKTKRSGAEAARARCGSPSTGSSRRAPVRVGWIGETSYEELQDKPKINGIEILGDKDGNDFGLANLSDLVGYLKVKEAVTAAQINALTSPVKGESYILSADGTVTNGYGGSALAVKKGDIVFYTVYSNWKLIASTATEQANWTQTDSTKPDYIKNKPDLSAVPFVVPTSTTLVELGYRYNQLLSALSGRSPGGYDQLPILPQAADTAGLRDAINLTILISQPMGGMPSVMSDRVTNDQMRLVFNQMKANIKGYDVSAVPDFLTAEDLAAWRTTYNLLAVTLKAQN